MTCVISSDLCPLLKLSGAAGLAQVLAREHRVPDMVLDRAQHPTGTILLDLSCHTAEPYFQISPLCAGV